jgi:hypothetical protein
MDKLDHLGWVAQRSYAVGNMIFGIRTTSELFCEWLDHSLGDYRTDEEADPYFSVVVGERLRERGSKTYHILYRSTQKVVRTFHLPTVGRALVAEIESLSFPQRTDAVYLNYGLIASNGMTALVPSALGWSVAGLGRRVDRAGLRLPATAAVAMDEAGTVIPTPATVAVPQGAFGELEDLGRSKPDRVWVESAVTPDLVFVHTGEKTPIQPVSRAWALARLAGGVYNLKELGSSALESLAGTVQSSACFGVGGVDAKGALGALTTAFRSI